MRALLHDFAACGVRFDLLEGDRVRAHGVLTEELRAAIRMHKPEILAELAANDGTPATDQDVERRRALALAILAEHPDRRLAVVAESDYPAHVAVAIRDVAVSELTIPAEPTTGSPCWR